jgi:hypothetical protein
MVRSIRLRLLAATLATMPLDDSDAAGAGADFTERDRMALKVTLDFGRTLTPDTYSSAVDYALSSDGASIRWLIARVCVERGQVDDAARLLVLVARIFEKGEAAAKLPRAEFERAIGYGGDHGGSSK